MKEPVLVSANGLSLTIATAPLQTCGYIEHTVATYITMVNRALYFQALLSLITLRVYSMWTARHFLLEKMER